MSQVISWSHAAGRLGRSKLQRAGDVAAGQQVVTYKLSRHCSHRERRPRGLLQASFGNQSKEWGDTTFGFHLSDLSSWEYAKKLKAILPQIEAAGIQVVVVGLGSRQNALQFSKLLDFPLRLLYAVIDADPEGVCYKALGFSPGFAADAPVSAYLKLLPMLAGIGSPGTIQEVLRGYVGDRTSKPVWDGSSAFNVLGKGYQRPLELATLRLNHMVNILPRWNSLCPANTALLTQQGGTLLFQDEQTVFRQDDAGILKYTSIADLTAAIDKLQQRSITSNSQV